MAIVESPQRHVPALLLGAALFGPYLIGGVRTEQATVYALALGAIPVLTNLRVTAAWTGVFAVWLSLIAVVTAVGLAPPPSTGEYGNLVAGLDNYALPLATLVVAAVWAHRRRLDALATFATTVCWFLAANALVTAMSVVVDLAPILQLFWSADPTAGSVAARAAGNARFSGIFNQPSESGLAYSFGLLLALWRWEWHEGRPRTVLVVLLLLVAGGLLSVSKIFVLGGLPVFFWAALLGRHGRGRRLLVMGGAALLGVGALTSGVLPWRGQQRLEQFLLGGGTRGGETSLLSYLTAGRFGERSTLRTVSGVVWRESPLLGYGAQGLQVPYDSTWLELFVIGGVVAVALFIAIGLILTLRTMSVRRCIARAEFRLAAAFLVIAAGASLGVPAHTANRASTMLWVVLGLTVLAPISRDPMPETEPRPLVHRAGPP